MKKMTTEMISTPYENMDDMDLTLDELALKYKGRPLPPLHASDVKDVLDLLPDEIKAAHPVAVKVLEVVHKVLGGTGS